MLNHLKSFLKVLWANIWPTYKNRIMFQRDHLSENPISKHPETYDECYKPNYMKTSEEYYGIPIEKKPSPLMVELLENANEIQKQWFRLQCLIDKAYPLSGDVSEQSVILSKMDEIQK